MNDKYPEQEFTITPTPYKILVDQVWDDCKSYLKNLPKNISRFITIAKTYKLKPTDIEKRLINENWDHIQHVFGRLANTIYSMYENELKKRKQIDFCDMINLAVDTLKKKPDVFKNLYDHILVDEFQDISMQRYEMIKTLMDLNPNCKLFCVGDDWQSIMGFSGSNLDFFVNFHKYFEEPARTDLTMNYRSVKSIIETGEEIIKKNEKCQLQKDVNAYYYDERPIQIIHSTHEEKYKANYYRQICDHCCQTIQTLLEDKEEEYSYDDFMILTRIANNPMLQDIFNELAAQYNHPIKLRSVHWSKGLQARHVFLMDIVDGLYGFPCQLEDPSIFEPARGISLDEKEAEERRLFYVAITRAKEDVCIYTQNGIESKFLNDITKYVNHSYLDWRTNEEINSAS